MHVTLRVGDDEFDLYLDRADGTVKVEVDGQTVDVKVVRDTPEGVELDVAGERFVVALRGDAAVAVGGAELPVHVVDYRPGGAPGAHGGAKGKGARVKPPMPGKVVSVNVKPGDEVQAGQVLLILEAMKMQNEIPSPAAGTVKAVHVKAGQAVEGKDLLVEIE